MRILWSIFLILGMILIWNTSSEAACAGSSPNRVAASASQTDVNDCVTAAANGDTINVPAGSASWSSDIDLPSNKNLTLRGTTVVTCSGTEGTSNYSCTAGAPTTTITCTTCFTINLATNHRITGFIMTGGSGERISSTGNQNISTHFRIDHNVLISTAGWQPIRFKGGSNGIHPQGIWDHNRFQNGVAIHTNGTLHQLDESDAQHVIWAEETPLGNSSKVIYLEDNFFTTSSSTTNYGDGNYGGRSVIRFNTTSGPAITAWEYHSPQGENRGYQRWENYHNHHVNLDAANSCYFGMHSLRGGTGVVFNNAMTGSVAGCNQSFSLDNVRSEDNVSGFGLCNGTHAGIDQNTAGQSGWHCRDQIGIARDFAQWNHSPVQAWNQEVKPAYLWGNTRSGSIVTGTVASSALNRTHIQANRDYYDHSTATDSAQTLGVRSGTIAGRPAACTKGVAYWATDEGEWNSNQPGPDGQLYKCTNTNTWTLYYTPYSYPHPWQTGGGSGGGDLTPPATPTNLRVQ